MKTKIENKIINISFSVFIIYIAILNFILADHQNILTDVLSIILSIVLIIAYKKIISINNVKLINILSIVILVLNFIFIIYLGINLMVSFEWDYARIQETAIDYANSIKMHSNNFMYFTRYPNNRLTMVMLAAIYKIAHVVLGITSVKSYVIVSIIINAIFIEASFVLTYILARKIKDEKFAFMTTILLVLMFPLLGYTSIYYTDTLSLLFFPLIILLYKRFNDSKNIVYLLLISMLSVIGFQIKATVIFALFTIIIDIVFKNNIKSIAKYIAILIISFGCINMAVDTGLNKSLHITQKDIDKYEFPHTHHIMMMLQGEGGYKTEEVIYTASFPTYNERKAANIKVIKRRVKKKGFGGITKHLFYTKVKRTWTDGNFAADNYLSRGPKYNSTKIYTNFWHSLYTYTGSRHNIYLVYTTTYWIVCMYGLILSAIYSKKEDINQLIKMIILILALFLTIWECHPRYIVQAIPIIVLLSNYGWNCLVEKHFIKKTKNKKQLAHKV